MAIILRKNLILFNVILLFCFLRVHGQEVITDQNNRKDSVKLLLHTKIHDTSRCKLLNELIELEEDNEIWPNYNEQLKSLCEKEIQNQTPGSLLHRFYLKHLGASLNNKGYLATLQGDNVTALKFYEKALAIDESLGNKKELAVSLNNLGSLYQYQGEIKKASAYYFRSLRLRQQINDKAGVAESFNNIGLLYDEQGDVLKALDYYRRGLKIQEQINNKKGKATAFNNIAQIYQQQGDTLRALEYYQQSLNIQEEVGDQFGAAGSFNNIAWIYLAQKKTSKALEFFEKSYTLSEASGNKAGMAYGLNNMAEICTQRGETSRALDLLEKALKLGEDIHEPKTICLSLNNLAIAHYKQGDLATAKRLSERSLKLAQELGFPGEIMDASKDLNYLYSETGDWKNAYRMLVLYKKMNDSINKLSNKKAALQMSFQYEYEKKTAADSIKVVEERKVFYAQLQQQKIQRTALYFGIALMTLFAFFMFNRFRVTQKQKKIIELKEKETQQQKLIIEQKHKEISDSINYAERIQRSFLATDEMLNSILQEYFIFYQPKDVVSGDFYWATHLANGNFALAVADSTGHGVPGAIMSLLNITSLEKASENNSDPADILNYTRQKIIQRLQKDGSEEGGKDGMDCSLLVFDLPNQKLVVAAANNPVWIIRSIDGHETCIETGFDKMPVGKHNNDHLSFTSETIDLIKGDMVYALTDGFADQFGGPRGKKFMQRRLKDLLISIAKERPADQKKTLTQTLNEWQGNLEQVDDMTIVGVRIC